MYWEFSCMLSSNVCELCVLLTARIFLALRIIVCNNILLENGNLATNFDIGFLPWTYYTKTFTSYFFQLNIGFGVWHGHLIPGTYVYAFACFLILFSFTSWISNIFLYRVYLVKHRPPPNINGWYKFRRFLSEWELSHQFSGHFSTNKHEAITW